MDMKRTHQCPKCGGSDIIADAKPIDRGHANMQKNFMIATFGNPDALIFKEQRTSTVSAWVCERCGYVEFYADSPASLTSGNF